MAELLSRLLSRQRRRNPFSDVMGPNPLESQAAMDAAQGADVSTPAPVSRRGPAADADGEGGIMLASTGGGGSPFRTAGGSGAADSPVQETGGPIRNFFSGGPAPMQRPSSGRRMDCSSGQCRMVDDGGFPVTSTVVGSPVMQSSSPMMTGSTVVSGAPVSGAPDLDFSDQTAMTQQAWQQQQMGQHGGRAFFERQRNNALIDDINAQNKVNDEFSRNLSLNAAGQARLKLDKEMEQADVEMGLTRAMTVHADETTATGSEGRRVAMKQKYLSQGGDPQTLAMFLARLDSKAPLSVDKDGNPIMPQGGAAVTATITPQMMANAEAEAYGTVAVHGVISHAMVLRDAKGLAENVDSRLVPRLPNEPDDVYADRKKQSLKSMYDETLYRAADTIISGLQRTDAWKKQDWLEVRAKMDSNVYRPLERSMRQLYATQRPMPENLSPADREAYLLEIDTVARERAEKFYDFFLEEAGDAFHNPEYRKDDSWWNNQWQQVKSFWGGDEAPEQSKPVDSNDTLPPHKYNPLGGIQYE
jgi:hypothetical protein